MVTTEEANLSNPLRVGLVGCGRVAQKHIAALVALNHTFRVVGTVEPDRARRARASAAVEAPGFATMDALLASENVDLVTLATPTGLHPAQAIAAAEAGADVLTEKPLGTSLQAGRSMVGRLAELDRRIFVVKQLRHHPLFLALRDALHSRRFGAIHTVGLQIFWTRPQSYYDDASWRGTKRLDGGALMNQASHYVDLLDWLFGSVVEVSAIGGALGRDIEVEDTAVVTLCWQEGFVGSLHVTMLTYPKNLATSLTVIGERGTVRLGGPACNRVEAWDFADRRPIDDEIEDLARRVPSTLQRGHEWIYRDIGATLRGREAPVVSGFQGLRSLAIIDAAYRALEEGGAVKVPRVRALEAAS